jgi:hypothetical protein
LRARDLFHGPWGASHAPNPTATYTFVERKRTGVNPGMTVLDPQGREWSVKQAPPGGLDNEGKVEVVVSRLLSAVGYHQPPSYYLPAFILGPWQWEENPFIGSQPYQGLLVLLMMFNSTDMKNSNNTLYEHRKGDFVEQWYVVRDVGAALGDTDRLAPRKGDVRAFEQHPFILGVTNRHVNFAYNGWYKKLVRDRITPDDVRWASSLLGQLSDRQWRDAFRAGGYSPDEANGFIRTLRAKIEQGREIGGRRASK